MSGKVDSINEVVRVIENTASLAEAADTLSSENSPPIAAVGAVHTLASNIPGTGAPGAAFLGSVGQAISFASVAAAASDGEFTSDDVAAASAALGAVLSRSPYPHAQAAGVYFSLYAISLPFLNSIGYWIGQRLPLPHEIAAWWNQAKGWQPPRDPIILDLDGNGLQTVGLASNIYFDHNGDGILSKTGWVGEGDALLVWDRNSNGLIDNGAELFGDFTPMPDGTLAPNGFAALAALDSNGDGVLDASDPAFAELKLWIDSDQNGVTGEGELISLADAGIASLNLGSTLKNQSQGNGNTLAREGSFTRTDGTESAMGEFHLAIDTFDTQFADPIEVPEELQGLPMMSGSGSVRVLLFAA